MTAGLRHGWETIHLLKSKTGVTVESRLFSLSVIGPDHFLVRESYIFLFSLEQPTSTSGFFSKTMLLKRPVSRKTTVSNVKTRNAHFENPLFSSFS